MKVRQAVITKPFATEVREVEIPDPAENQILVAAEFSAISPGTELAVYTGTHQWLLDPNLPDWKFPFRSGYSAAGTVVKVGSKITGWKPGDRVSFPRQPRQRRTADDRPGARPTVENGRQLDFETAALAVIIRYGMGASIRAA